MKTKKVDMSEAKVKNDRPCTVGDVVQTLMEYDPDLPIIVTLADDRNIKLDITGMAYRLSKDESRITQLVMIGSLR